MIECGASPLWIACFFGHLELARWLVKVWLGANQRLRSAMCGGGLACGGGGGGCGGGGGDGGGGGGGSGPASDNAGGDAERCFRAGVSLTAAAAAALNYPDFCVGAQTQAAEIEQETQPPYPGTPFQARFFAVCLCACSCLCVFAALPCAADARTANVLPMRCAADALPMRC